jgi:hypothetical protein
MALFAAVTVAGLVYLRLTAIPVRDISSLRGPSSAERGKAVDPDSAIRRAIFRARIDQLINPLPRSHRLTGIFAPVEPREESPDEINLVFFDRVVEPTWVLYRYSRAKRRLVWKGLEEVSP